MPVEISVQGANELAVISAHLKKVGNTDLRRELFRGLNRATKPMKAAVKASARDRLPKHGGLNTLIAGSRLSTSNRGSGRNVGVRITGKLSGHDLPAINRGRLRHPVFGHQPWVNQSVDAGFFTDPIEARVDLVRHELLDVLEDVARKAVDG